ncbi:MAG: ATP-dependent DNA helicase [Candidatus Micrarchaeia archaeon]|jgi:DNA helicase-2/ATP-dependent DNA helicase PcrA
MNKEKMLNINQKKAVEKTEGSCLIIAGPGTGKTFTLTKKIAYLIENNIYDPSEILCLTFSNEATNNLKEEVEKELKQRTDITIRTFHGFSADILKEFGQKIGIENNFEILLPNDAKVFLYKDLGASAYNASIYESSMSTAKDFGITLDEIKGYVDEIGKEFKNIENLEEYAKKLDMELKLIYLESSYTKEQRKDILTRKKEIKTFLEKYQEYNKYLNFAETWEKYIQMKNEKNYLDYSDLNSNVILLFKTFGAEGIAKKYKYILIDEFQDTNKLQFELISFLAKDHKNITVVGDPNQSIYAFRGAYMDNFTHFEKEFELKKEDIFKLNKSHRSPNTVLRSAYKLIKNNFEEIQDTAFLIENADDREGEKVKVFELKNKEEEACKVAELVEEEIKKGTPLKEICVLCRTHLQAKIIKKALEAKNIIFVYAGQTDLMEKSEIKTAVAYLSIIDNLIERTGTGEQSWWCLFTKRNNMSPKDCIKIGRYLKKGESIDYTVLHNLTKLDLSENGKRIIQKVISGLEKVIESADKPFPELLLDIYEFTGLSRSFTHERNVKNTEALMNLTRFYEIAENYYNIHSKNLSSFIHYIEILDKLGVTIPASRIQDIDAVRLMTIHATKGLQFKKVILTNLADKRFPISRTPREPLIPKLLNPAIKEYLNNFTGVNIEKAIKEYEKDSLLLEERRLCYVALTRTKEELILTYAMSYNKDEDSTSASIFLNEMEYLENQDMECIIDNEERFNFLAPMSEYEQFKYKLKDQFIKALDSDNLDSLMSRLANYYTIREGRIVDLSVDLNKLIDKDEMEEQLKMCETCSSGLKFTPSSFTFDPSSIITYIECPKKYEFKKLYRMPERGAFDFSNATVGSFIHEILEKGVEQNLKSKEEFFKLTEDLSKEEKWKGIDLDESKDLVTIFWERNKNKYNENSKVEVPLSFELEGFRFYGKADRIDFLDLDKKEVEIIDYKTGEREIPLIERSMQLGFYAIALIEMGYKPKKITLELLKCDKPITGIVKENGDVEFEGRITNFNINDIKTKLLKYVNDIITDYEHTFTPVIEDYPCRNCGYKFYCPKWDD